MEWIGKSLYPFIEMNQLDKPKDELDNFVESFVPKESLTIGKKE